jgi:predicted tellurium resistance membrane protein TerC
MGFFGKYQPSTSQSKPLFLGVGLAIVLRHTTPCINSLPRKSTTLFPVTLGRLSIALADFSLSDSVKDHA